MRSFGSRTRFYHRAHKSRFLSSLARITKFKDQHSLASSELTLISGAFVFAHPRAQPNFSHSTRSKVLFFHHRDSYFKPSFPSPRFTQPSRLTFHPHRRRLCPMQLLSPRFLFRLVASLPISCLPGRNIPSLRHLISSRGEINVPFNATLDL